MTDRRSRKKPDPELPPELAELLPQAKADRRLVWYTTPAIYEEIDSRIEALVDRFPGVPKNVVHQIAVVLVMRQWDLVEELVRKYHQGEPLKLTVAQPHQGSQAS